MYLKNQKEYDDARSLSESEVIERLKEHGVQIAYKPIAIVPMYMRDNEYIKEYGMEEMDIYETLNIIENRNRVIKNKDPFSDEI